MHCRSLIRSRAPRTAPWTRASPIRQDEAPMRRFLPVACLLAGVMSMATPVSAQTLVLPIAMGETVQGRLEASDPLLTDGSRYELYLYRGQAGELLRLTLRSADFDGYLSGGRI